MHRINKKPKTEGKNNAKNPQKSLHYETRYEG